MTSSHEGFTFEYQFRDFSEPIIGKNMALKHVDISKEAVISRFNRNIMWLTDDKVILSGNEREFIDLIEESIDDLSLMVSYGFRSESKEVGEDMIVTMQGLKSDTEKVLEYLISEVYKQIWFIND